MEHSPIDSGSEVEVSDKKETRSRKKKKAEHLGSFAIKPEAGPKVAAPDKKPPLAQSRTELKPEVSAETKAEKSAEAPLETLSPAEKQYVEQELVRSARQADAEQFPRAAEGTAAAAVEFFRGQIEDGTDSDAALAETLAAVEKAAVPGETEGLEAEDAVQDREDLAENGLELREFADEDEISFKRRESARDSEAELPENPLPAGQAGSGGSNRGGQQPPSSTGGPAIGSFGRPSFNAVPATAEKTYHPDYDEGSPAAAALLGGIIGYLIGRRRGRIKTEKKLLPVQKKLQKEVVDLQWQLKSKEDKIRRTVRENSQLKQETLLAAVQKRAAERPLTKSPEAALPLGVPVMPEHLGHVIVTAEAARLTPKPETKPGIAEPAVKKPEPEAPKITKRVETLNRAELMEISDQIYVEGSSLRQVYENHLIGEKGLRRLVAEHLRGSNMKRALKREIIEREIDFERDPVMRGLAPASGGGSSAGSLQTLLKKAAAALPSDDEQIAYLKARSAYEAEQRAKQKKQQHVLDVALVGLIAALAAVIIVLLLKR